MDSSNKVPRPGTNKEFDRHVATLFGDVDPSQADIDELRLAAWTTWKIEAPSMGEQYPQGGADEHDDDLALAIALSMQDQDTVEPGTTKESAIAIDSDDESPEHAANETAPAVERRRSETPEEERRMLAEAIAASLASNHEPKESGRALNVDQAVLSDTSSTVDDPAESDDDDEVYRKRNEELRRRRTADRENQLRERVLKRAKLSGSSSPVPAAPSQSHGSPVEDTKPKPSLSLSGLGDRAALERARLARQAQSSGSVTLNGAGSRSGEPRPPLASVHPLQGLATSSSRDKAGEFYLMGEMRHVSLNSNICKVSDRKTFSAREVFGSPDQIQLLVMSSYGLDGEWAYGSEEGFLPSPKKVPSIYITGAPEEALQGSVREFLDGTQEAGLVACFPPMKGQRGVQHIKFAWIWYKTGRLRVAIMTANLHRHDWTSIENTVFVQDFLPKAQTLSGAKEGSRKGDDFVAQFRRLFRQCKVHEGLRFLKLSHACGRDLPIGNDQLFDDLSKWDFSRVQVRVVISVPRVYEGEEEMSKAGICRLATVLREEGWTPGSNEQLVGEYQSSSLGVYSVDWFNNFYQSINGKTISALSRLAAVKYTTWPPLSVVFPSLKTVDASYHGRPGGGTMFCRPNVFTDKTAHLFRDAKSKRGGVLMHTKMLIALFNPREHFNSSAGPSKRKREDDEEKDVTQHPGGWIYMGSHNFSRAAWGSVNYKKMTLTISNYELGIVFPLPRADPIASAKAIAPQEFPAPKYGKDDIPFMQEKHMPS